MELINIFITIIVFAVSIIIIYYLLIHIIRIWCGCSKLEAERKIHNLFYNKPVYRFENDAWFYEEVWINISQIIGTSRYSQLEQLSKTSLNKPLLFIDNQNGLSAIYLSLYFKDNNEKATIEAILSNLIKKYLEISGYYTDIIIKSGFRKDLNMPYLKILYARNEEEKRILDICLDIEKRNIISKNTSITDDTEEVRLDDDE